MNLKVALTALTLTLALSFSAKAAFLKLPDASAPLEHPPYPGNFVIPNELHPQDAEPILKLAGTGILLGVGSERIYFHYLQAPEVTHLVAVDYDPQIILFHQLNEILIKASPRANRSFYRKLRFNTSNWRLLLGAAVASRRITIQEKLFATSPMRRQWWNQRIIQEREWEAKLPQAMKGESGLLYWESDRAFVRLQELVQSGRFQIHRIDLGSKPQVKDLVDAILKSNIRFSVLDLSNAWESAFPNSYLGALKTNHLLESVNAISDPATLVFFTRGVFTPPRNIFYLGYDFTYLRRIASEVSSWSGVSLGWEIAHIRMEDDTNFHGSPLQTLPRTLHRLECPQTLTKIR